MTPAVSTRTAQERQDTEMPVRVFLLDDHELVRRGIRDLLWAEDDMAVVGDAATAEEALERIPQTRPDVAVFDVRLGEGSGIEVCREIRSAHPEVACVMLTSFADDEALFASIMAGASGYVLKQIRGSELVSAIRRVAAGESLLDPVVTARVLERLRHPRPEEADPLAALSAQERRILDLIAEGKTNRQIGEAMFLAEKTVKNYVSHVLAKLGMQRRTEAAALRRPARRTSRGSLIAATSDARLDVEHPLIEKSSADGPGPWPLAAVQPVGRVYWLQRPELSMTPRRRKVEHIGPWFRRRHWSALNLALLIAVSVWLVGFLLPGDRSALAGDLRPPYRAYGRDVRDQGWYRRRSSGHRAAGHLGSWRWWRGAERMASGDRDADPRCRSRRSGRRSRRRRAARAPSRRGPTSPCLVS